MRLETKSRSQKNTMDIQELEVTRDLVKKLMHDAQRESDIDYRLLEEAVDKINQVIDRNK